MLKKVITYTNFDGNEVTEEMFFNLTAVELTKLQARLGMPIDEYASKCAKSLDLKKMLDFIEIMVLESFGRKSDDGKRFMKGPEVKSEFEYSAAYAELFEELLTSPGQAQAFGEGLVQGAKPTAPNQEAAQLLAAQKEKQQSNVTSLTE